VSHQRPALIFVLKRLLYRELATEEHVCCGCVKCHIIPSAGEGGTCTPTAKAELRLCLTSNQIL
jgi:hypothetical protein